MFTICTSHNYCLDKPGFSVSIMNGTGAGQQRPGSVGVFSVKVIGRQVAQNTNFFAGDTHFVAQHQGFIELVKA